MMKKKNIIVIIVVLFVTLIGYFSYDSYLFSKTIKDKKTDKTVRLTYVMVDYDKTKDIDFNNFSEYFKYLLGSYTTSENLELKGDKYVGHLNEMSDSVFKNIALETFVINNVFGEIVDDCSYDNKTRTVTIPKKYFEDEEYSEYWGKNGGPIRLELVSRMKKKDYNNPEINSKITKFISKKKKIVSTYSSEHPKVSLFKYGKGTNIKKSDFKVYINSQKESLNNKYLDYNPKSGVLTIDKNPVSINKIDIKFKKSSLLKNVFGIFFESNSVKALDTSAIKGYVGDADIEIDDGGGHADIPALLNGEKIDYSADYIYDASQGYFYNGISYSDDARLNNVINKSIKANNSNESATYWDFYIYIGTLKWIKNYTYPDPNDSTKKKTATGSITIKVNKWLNLACIHAGSGHENNPKRKLNLSVTLSADDYESGLFSISLNSLDTAGNQTATGSFAVYTEHTELYELQIQKFRLDDGKYVEWPKKKGIYYRLYSGFNSDETDCNGTVIGTALTDSTGLATFTSLTENAKYCVKEIMYDSFSTPFEAAKLKGEDYQRDSECNGGKKVMLVAYTTDHNVTNNFVNNYCNYRKKWCTAIEKKDAESETKLEGITFQIKVKDAYEVHGVSAEDAVANANVGSPQTTDSNGFAKFEHLKWHTTYYIVETSSDGTTPSNYSYKFWNDTNNNDGKVDVSKSNLKEETLTKNSDGTYSYTCSLTSKKVTKEDHKYYYCFKVKKVDQDSGAIAKGASFKTTINGTEVEHADDWDGSKDGYITFFTSQYSGSFTATETKAPEGGYALSNKPVTATVSKPLPRELSVSEAEAECKKAAAKYNDGTRIDADAVVAKDSKLILNWYKVTENGETSIDGAKFKVYASTDTNQTTPLKFKERQSYTANKGESNEDTRSCYVYSTEGTIDELEATTVATGHVGEVCVTGVELGTYTVVETKPAKYHTFDSTSSKNIAVTNDSTTFAAKTDANKFINRPTEFEFDKLVSEGDDDEILTKLTTAQLMNIPFNIFNNSGTKLSFILKDGVYHYASEDYADKVSGTATTELYLDGSRKFKIEHLPAGTYTVKEYGGKTVDGACVCTDDNGRCIGFSYPTYNSSNSTSYTFTVNDCTSEKAKQNTTACPSGGKATKNLTNKPTELWFTKKDFYGYEDAADVVDFENDKERNDFDKITFKVKESKTSTTYLRFLKIGPKGSGKCLSDSDYREYRYISDEYYNEMKLTLTEEEFEDFESRITTDLNTCGGHIRITHLCRGKTYYVEETSVPSDSVFTLPDDVDNRITEYSIPCCEGTTTIKNTKTIIKDKGTRIRLEKRDAKYNYIIPDSRTTFRIYQCEQGVECHPTSNPDDMSNATGVRKQMVFTPRAKLTSVDIGMPLDEEDGTTDGAVTWHNSETGKDYEATYEVYKSVSDSDKENMSECTGNNTTNCYVTDLHPDHGILIMRYLPGGYNYVAVEVASPQGYMLPEGTNAETKFTVTSQTVKVEEINVAQTPVSLVIRKYNHQGALLAGTSFKISKAKNCNMNVAANKVETEGALKLKTIRDGIYEARPEGDTTVFKTCTNTIDQPCSNINNTLTYSSNNEYENYVGKVADYGLKTNSNNETVPIEEGEALIQYLDFGACYVIEEVKAPLGYSLPENEEDRFVMIKITDKEQIFDTYDELINYPTPFSFYKLDEKNEPLDGAKYKLQKLNDEKKYIDIPVSLDETFKDQLVYKVDSKSTNYIMETMNGKATITYLEEGQYRVLEVEAPDKYELPKKTMNVATFFVDEEGNVYGNSIIANKPKTDKKKLPTEAEAKFVINIQTGQKIVKYGLIISVIIIAIVGLIFLQRKNKK